MFQICSRQYVDYCLNPLLHCFVWRAETCELTELLSPSEHFLPPHGSSAAFDTSMLSVHSWRTFILWGKKAALIIFFWQLWNRKTTERLKQIYSHQLSVAYTIVLLPICTSSNHRAPLAFLHRSQIWLFWNQVRIMKPKQWSRRDKRSVDMRVDWKISLIFALWASCKHQMCRFWKNKEERFKRVVRKCCPSCFYSRVLEVKSGDVVKSFLWGRWHPCLRSLSLTPPRCFLFWHPLWQADYICCTKSL